MTRRTSFEKEALPHLDALYGLALRLTRNERDAEDLVQDAVVKAYRFYDQFESGSNAKAWLFKIVTNTFYNRVRKNNNIRRLESDAEVGGHYDRFLSAATTAGRNAEALILDRLAAHELQAAIDELPEDFRISVLLCDLYDFSYKEIAEIIGCPVGTVMSRLYRGRRLLQSRLYDYAVEQGVIRPASGDEAAADLDAFRRRKQAGDVG